MHCMLRRHARAASGVFLEKTALCFQLVHPADNGQQAPPQFSSHMFVGGEIVLTVSLSGSFGLPSS